MNPEPKRPLLVAIPGAALFLGFVQAAALMQGNQSFASVEMAIGLTKMSIIVSLVTMILLAPLAMVLRRWHPGWANDERLRATWAASIAIAAALAGWIIGQQGTGAFLKNPARAIVAILMALLMGWIAYSLQPSTRWIKNLRWVSIVLVVLCFAPYPPSPGGAKKSAPEPEPKPATARADQPDVVLISIDTLRTDHLGVYGQAPTLTPEIDRLGKEGVVFERALAGAPWTTPSVASMLTGLPVARHGAALPLHSGSTIFTRSPFEDKLTTIAERFKAAGYRTNAIVASGVLAQAGGMVQGFDLVENPMQKAMFAGFMRDLPLPGLIVSLFPQSKLGDFRADGVSTSGLKLLSEASDRPLFLWLHYIDTHVPYRKDPSSLDLTAFFDMIHGTHPPLLPDGTVVGDDFGSTDLVRSGTLWLGPEDKRRIAQLYKGCVTYTDKHVGRVIDALRARKSGRKVIVALTADHGEEFWEHGGFEHGHDYYREITWIPLVFWGPSLVPEGKRVKSLAGIVDVMPTLLDMAGVPVEAPGSPDSGRSVAALLKGDVPDDHAPPRFCGSNLYGLPSVLMEEGPWRYILRANDVQELYDITKDPHERHNLVFEHPDVAARARKVMEPELAALVHTAHAGGPQEMSLEQIESLKALGYVH